MSAHLPIMPPSKSGDITITTTHREVMRRLDQGESLTEAQVDTLGAPYLHEPVDDVAVEGQPFRMPALTSLGRRVLDVSGVLTTRQERPRLVSRPMPERWTHVEYAAGYLGDRYKHTLGGVYQGSGDRFVATADLASGFTNRAETRTMARDLIALIDWLDHEDAVRAQDGGS